MPFTKKQEGFFNAVSHGMKPKKGNLSQGTAKRLANEARSMPTKPPVRRNKRPKSGNMAALREANFKNRMSSY